jgi:hypothetical protein
VALVVQLLHVAEHGSAGRLRGPLKLVRLAWRLSRLAKAGLGTLAGLPRGQALSRLALRRLNTLEIAPGRPG